MLLGCIGDDFTGSSDLANTLAKGGMRVTQYTGVPGDAASPDVEAGVVALKSRTIPVAEAVAQSLAALDWLQAQGCRQFFFKYCSTFDSTKDGNIGPVAEALAGRLNADAVIFCPAFPATGRSIYQGHLFVGDTLLSESGMQNHPLTPMTDPDLRRWLSHQTSRDVGHVAMSDIGRGVEAIREAIAREVRESRPLVVVDAIHDADLLDIGAAVAEMALVTGGSGVALGLPENFRRNGLLSGAEGTWRGTTGPGVVLSGSCSTATRGQVAAYMADHPAYEITADAVMTGEVTSATLVAWATDHLAESPILYSSADPDVVRAAQDQHGVHTLASRIETLFSETAAGLVAAGVERIVTAGGETSGAVVEGLRIPAFEIGPEIDAGVPAVRDPSLTLALALKSGNFGDVDFFARALRVLGGSK